MAINLDVNDKSLIVPNHGTLFIADATNGEVALPTDLSKFSLLTKSVDSTWYNIGHTSNDNKLSMSTDGGEATTKATWLVPNARTTYSAITATLTGKSVQGDKNTIKFIYNGTDGANGKGVNISLNKTARKVSLLVLAQDDGTGDKFGLYIPNCSFTYDGLPNFSGDNFAEFGFSASILTSTTLGESINGKPSELSVLTPEDFAAPAGAAAVSGTTR